MISTVVSLDQKNHMSRIEFPLHKIGQDSPRPRKWYLIMPVKT